MTTAELVESHLGSNWATRDHDDTALLSLLDRVAEEFDTDTLTAVRSVAKCAEDVHPDGKNTLVEVRWSTRLWTLLRSVSPSAVTARK